jgi:hypothetical protein
MALLMRSGIPPTCRSPDACKGLTCRAGRPQGRRRGAQRAPGHAPAGPRGDRIVARTAPRIPDSRLSARVSLANG